MYIVEFYYCLQSSTNCNASLRDQPMVPIGRYLHQEIKEVLTRPLVLDGGHLYSLPIGWLVCLYCCFTLMYLYRNASRLCHSINFDDYITKVYYSDPNYRI
jgi:hypothetical protein